MPCSIFYVISIVLSPVSSCLKSFLSAIFKGTTINILGEVEIKKKSSDLEKKKKGFFSATNTSKNSALCMLKL